MITVLTRAWLLLIAFSFATTVFAGVLPEAGPIFVAAVLALAGVKSRLILSDYLGLRNAPTFQRGFTLILVGFLSLAMLLYALPSAM
ncbi:cytochrome C oxidase subunit IV family protein [uncultured Shimia sp.]|uniref:cytochrome C oxidase subunit IV family protein n=1 Tax=uncultured Shimia sp. TaxID=573152 RepID=UPI0025CC7322|nr:cytochrome C oxidase subunit IV family protein [uncultured Shimia sp.]